MKEQEILESIRQSAKEDHEFFGNKNKSNREKYVASLFLSILGVDYNENDLHVEVEISSVDIVFGSYKFQIKELMDEGYPRGKIYKERRKCAENASSLAELSFVSDAYDVPHPDRMYNLVLKEIPSYSKKYVLDDRKQNDLLIYVTRTRAAPFCDEEIVGDDLSSFGWRSISCVNKKQAVVLFSSNEASTLMKRHTGQVIGRPKDLINA